MTDNYDVIVIGGGHNGLTTAAYLAKSGKKVLVLEARDRLGGASSTSEFHPGYRVSDCAHLLYSLEPEIEKDLNLARNGLAFAAQNLSTVNLSDSGKHLTLGSGGVTGEDLSTTDVSRFKTFDSRMRRYAKLLGKLNTQLPPALTNNSPGQLWNAAMLALKVRLLGKEDLEELLRIGAINIYDILQEQQFDSDLLKGALAMDGVLGGFTGPRSNGTVLTWLQRNSTGRGYDIPAGGMGAIGEAFASAAKSFGVECHTGARVSRILVESGTVTGLELEDGSSLSASCVISNLDPRTTFADLIGYRNLETEFARRIHTHRAKGTAAKLHLALDGLPEVPGLNESDLGQRLLIAPGLDDIERAFNPVKYNEASINPVMEISIASLHDKSLAPEGHHVLSAVVQFAPHEPKTNEVWAEFETNIMRVLERYLPGIRSKVIASELLMPEDLGERFGNHGGHWHHGELSLDQFLTLRPVHGAAHYSTPVAGLYLCGASTHPGGNVMGAAGKNCADVVNREQG